MLDIPNTGSGNEKQTRTTQVRHGDDLADLIDRAAAHLGVDKSAFLRHAIAKEAQRVLERSAQHVLTAEDAAQFQAALDTPPPATPRALKAAADYRRRVAFAE